MNLLYYPASPVTIPKDFTTLPASYKLRASLAIFGILAFFILYFSLVAFLGWLVYLAVMYEMDTISKWTILLKLGTIAGAAMLFVFTLKFIFKLKNFKPDNRLEIQKKDHLEIWNFVNQICKETGASKPNKIYLDPDVNAYVSYSNTWLSLFWPVKKDLTIGLGLVNCLNLTEFKAVVAHEFGHFAQRSMKIGSFIISANTIIHDMIYTRDSWDQALVTWRSSDIRLSAAAWVITPVIWLIRQALSLFYSFLNMMHSSLSREMEFNADKVAVSTTGSEAIVSALWKLDFGSESWNNTVNHAYLASQKTMFAKNLYAHNTINIEKNHPKQLEKIQALPPDKRGGKIFFSQSENSKVGMYTSHPPNDMRENNAKTPFIDCPADERSPWNLFTDHSSVQEKMTALVYKKYLHLEPMNFVSDQEFERFIFSETQGAELLAEYDNTFLNRFIYIPTKEELEAATGKISDSFTVGCEKLKLDLAMVMQPVKDIELLMDKAKEISEGTTKETNFSFQGVEYNKKNLQDGFANLFEQREILFSNEFKNWDIDFCAFNYKHAKNKDKQQYLWNVYQQHDALANLFRMMVESKNLILARLRDLQVREDVTPEEISSLTNLTMGKFKDLNSSLKNLDSISFVPLPNIDTIVELKEAIVKGGTFKVEGGLIFENGGFDKMFHALDSAISHCQRLDQKSIVSILLFQNDLKINS